MTTRKIFAALCGMLMIAPAGFAQHNMYVADKNGTVSVIPVSQVTKATFSSDSWITVTDDGTTGKSNTSISASCTATFTANNDVKHLTATPEVGVCYSKDNTTPTVNNDHMTLGNEMKSYSFTISSLISGTKYYYRAYVKLGDAIVYGDVHSSTTLGQAPNDKVIGGHKFLDLALPSGILWAETNIGAATAADDGNYYAWGETATKSIYSWATYTLGSLNNPSKYSTADGKTTLENCDDAAYTNWGKLYRMPSNDEFTELLNSDNCTWTWTSMTNSAGTTVNGYMVVSKRNGNSIFLPASGFHYGEMLNFYGSRAYYWTSSLSSSGVNYGDCLSAGSNSHSLTHDSRICGFQVRPVVKL